MGSHEPPKRLGQLIVTRKAQNGLIGMGYVGLLNRSARLIVDTRNVTGLRGPSSNC